MALPALFQAPRATSATHEPGAHREHATLMRDTTAANAESATSDSRASASDARRFDAPWEALAATALLVAACQWLSARERRGRQSPPLTTRAPARAPPLFTSFASAS
jgi:hypothetical protein